MAEFVEFLKLLIANPSVFWIFFGIVIFLFILFPKKMNALIDRILFRGKGKEVPEEIGQDLSKLPMEVFVLMEDYGDWRENKVSVYKDLLLEKQMKIFEIKGKEFQAIAKDIFSNYIFERNLSIVESEKLKSQFSSYTNTLYTEMERKFREMCKKNGFVKMTFDQWKCHKATMYINIEQSMKDISKAQNPFYFDEDYKNTIGQIYAHAKTIYNDILESALYIANQFKNNKTDEKVSLIDRFKKLFGVEPKEKGLKL